MRVEVVQPGVDHGVDHLLPVLVVELADVVLVHQREHLDDLLDELVVLVRRRGGAAEGQAEEDDGRDGQQPGQVPKGHATLRNEEIHHRSTETTEGGNTEKSSNSSFSGLLGPGLPSVVSVPLW